MPNNFSDPELYYKTESNQIWSLVAYFLKCKHICISLEFFPYLLNHLNINFWLMDFLDLNIQQAKHNWKIVDKTYKK